MTPKEKAQELVNNFKSTVYKKAFADTDYMYDRYYGLDDEMSKQCALIAVNEIIYNISGLEDSVWYNNASGFWEEVKQKIKEL